MQQEFKMSVLVCNIPEQKPVKRVGKKNEHFLTYMGSFRNKLIRIVVSEYCKDKVLFGDCYIKGYPVVQNVLGQDEITFFALRIRENRRGAPESCTLRINCKVKSIGSMRYYVSGEQHRALCVSYSSPESTTDLTLNAVGALARKCAGLQNGQDVSLSLHVRNAMPLSLNLYQIHCEPKGGK